LPLGAAFYIEKDHAPVAQLDRALPSEGRGQGFESLRARQQSQDLKPYLSEHVAVTVRSMSAQFVRRTFSGTIRDCHFPTPVHAEPPRDRDVGLFEFLVPAKPRARKRFAAMKQTLSCSEQRADTDALSLVVDSPCYRLSTTRTRSIDRLPTRRRLKRSTAAWGITGPELDRLDAALHFMKLHCQPRLSSLWWVTTDSPASRELIADVWKRITRLQSQYHLRPYSVAIFECSGGLHAHIIFIGTSKIARNLEASQQFGDVIHVRRVTDPYGLFQYLAKERTPQAGYRREHIFGGRRKGSHRLPGGGDRVRLSRQLERDAIEAGYVEPWQHKNAKRKLDGSAVRGVSATPLAGGADERTGATSTVLSSPFKSRALLRQE
jgi:hypothetical protein